MRAGRLNAWLAARCLRFGWRDLAWAAVNESYQDSTLMLVAHGSRQNADSCAPVFQHAAALRRRALFGEVAVAFCKQAPFIREVLPTLSARRIFVVPLFIGEGYFAEEFIPRELGLVDGGSGNIPRLQRRGARSLHYCGLVGTHPSMMEVLLARADGVVEQHPAPQRAQASEITLFLAGHGTGWNENSRKTIERHVERIRARRLYADVRALFLEEPPRIGECYRLAKTRHLVVVPCFISDGLHATEHIPVLLGEEAEVVRARRGRGEWPWRNPTERKSKWVWYTPSIGSEPHLPDVILERVRESAAAAAPAV
jgi:sirohydrochlorin cobaltochelatase